MESKFFDTIYGTIECVELYNGGDDHRSIYDMYDEQGCYLGEVSTDDVDNFDAIEVEDAIEENGFLKKGIFG